MGHHHFTSATPRSGETSRLAVSDAERIRPPAVSRLNSQTPRLPAAKAIPRSDGQFREKPRKTPILRGVSLACTSIRQQDVARAPRPCCKAEAALPHREKPCKPRVPWYPHPVLHPAQASILQTRRPRSLPRPDLHTHDDHLNPPARGVRRRQQRTHSYSDYRPAPKTGSRSMPGRSAAVRSRRFSIDFTKLRLNSLP